MEVKIQRPAYYFSWPDEEILDEKLLEIPDDDETWLYRVERGGYNGHYQTLSQPNHYHTPSGSVDSRTFTRRKHALRPSLESVAESPLFNRSSLGILSASHLNDTKLGDYSTTPISTSRGRISSSFTASDKESVPRVFKLDTPFINYTFERKRHDSELSDSSIIPSLDSHFDKNEVMTDSLVNFLEKPNEKCQPPDGFRDEKSMTESLVSLSEKESGLELSEEAMTDSMVNFLEPVACKPPSGFGDEEMCNSIVDIDDKDVLPASDMTNSLMDYLECGKLKIDPLTRSVILNEAENIPPERVNIREEELTRLNTLTDGKSNTTFEIKKDRENAFGEEDNSEESPEITFTNNINISRTKKERIDIEEDRCFTRPLNTTFEKENESIHKLRSLNNKDLNKTRDMSDEDTKEFNLSRFKMPNKTNSSALVNCTRLNGTQNKTANENSTRFNGTFTKSAYENSGPLNGTFTKSANENSTHFNDIDSSRINGTFTKNSLNLSRQIPQRNSTFNTTFTKLPSPPKDLPRHMVTRSTECLDGAEDDQASTASDSSFSSAASSTKPRSVDELRTIAQQQESNLADFVQSSTPTEVGQTTKHLAQLDLELSPIRRASLEGRRVSESRSAHCSPVRSPMLRPARPHPVAQLQQPAIEMRRQTLQASSLSNLALTRSRTSGLRMPQATGRVSRLMRPEASRPTTAPTPAPNPTAIPRPQASRLPMPRFRGSGIPTMKRGGQH